MRTKQRPLIEEVPMVVIGFAAATVGALAYGAVLGTSRAFLHLTGQDHRSPATH